VWLHDTPGRTISLTVFQVQPRSVQAGTLTHVRYSWPRTAIPTGNAEWTCSNTDFDRTVAGSDDVTLSYGEYAHEPPADVRSFLKRADRFVDSYEVSLHRLMREWPSTLQPNTSVVKRRLVTLSGVRSFDSLTLDKSGAYVAVTTWVDNPNYGSNGCCVELQKINP
jgi:hypothetical protein